jgi:hypothetical protein
VFLSNVGSFQNGTMELQLFIEDDGFAQELFEQFITDIVDGANNKWIGTASWYHDGQKLNIIYNKIRLCQMCYVLSILTVLQERFYSYCKDWCLLRCCNKANDDLENVYATPYRSDLAIQEQLKLLD